MKKLSMFLSLMLCGTALVQSVKGMDAVNMDAPCAAIVLPDEIIDAGLQFRVKIMKFISQQRLELEKKAQKEEQGSIEKYFLEKCFLEGHLPSDPVLLIRQLQAALFEAEMMKPLKEELERIEKKLKDPLVSKWETTELLEQRQAAIDAQKQTIHSLWMGAMQERIEKAMKELKKSLVHDVTIFMQDLLIEPLEDK